MSGRKNFFDEFYSETMSEMADNFFSRRREMEARLEGFSRLAAEVKAVAGKALRRWKTLFILLGDEETALDFCQAAGMDASGAAAAMAGVEPWRFKAPFALTEARRYRACLRYAYQAMAQATLDYLDGTYAMDSRNPLKKVLTPNLVSLRDLADTINAEVRSINTNQSPTSMLAYVKSLDPAEVEREAIVGGQGCEDVCRIDRDLAFTPVDFKALGLPALPRPPEPEDARDTLDAFGSAVFGHRKDACRRAMAQVTAV